MDGACRPGAEMASRIKARGLKGRALAPLIGRLPRMLHGNTTASRRTKPYTEIVNSGGRNFTPRPHRRLANETLHQSSIGTWQMNPYITSS